MEMQKNDGVNESLDGLFVAFVHTVLSRMDQWIMEKGLWGAHYLRCDFEANTHHVKMDHTKEFGLLLNQHLSDILMMEETQRCVEKHVQAGVLPVSTNETDEATLQAVRYLIVPIAKSCTIWDSWSLDDLTDDYILEQYHRCRTAWGDADSHFTITFPLINFWCDMPQPRQLSTHLLLAPLTPSDKTTLWNDYAKLFGLSPPLDVNTLTQSKWKLFGTFSAPKKEDASDIDNTRQEALDELGDVMSAMHLLKEGDVGAPAIYQKRLTPVLSEGARMCYPLNQVRQFPSNEAHRFPSSIPLPYVFRESDIIPLQVLVKALQQLRLAQSRDASALYGDLSVGLRRFNQSYERRIPEDQIIDLTIALESILLEGLEDELKYRLAVRGAALLADAEIPWAPQASKTLLFAMYDVRSGIVHSGQQLSDQKVLKKIRKLGMQPEDFLQQCEQIVRDVLKAYVQRRKKGQSVKDVNEDLEARIADGLGAQMSPTDVSQQP